MAGWFFSTAPETETQKGGWLNCSPWGGKKNSGRCYTMRVGVVVSQNVAQTFQKWCLPLRTSAGELTLSA